MYYPTRNVKLPHKKCYISYAHIIHICTYICVCVPLLCVSSQQALQALSLIPGVPQPSEGCPYSTSDAPRDSEGTEAFSCKFAENWKHV